VQGGKEEEEEEVNVDDQMGQGHEEVGREEQKLKTEINGETTSGKMES